jgi:O-antigen ligase
LNTLLAAATTAFLFLAPITGSAGLRSAALILAAVALGGTWRADVAPHLAKVPRAVAAMFLLWVLMAVASLAWSVDPRYTLAELRNELLYATLAMTVFFFAAQQPRRWRTWCAALLAGTFAMFAIYMAESWFGLKLSRHPVFEMRGPWSTHLVLVAPLVLALSWRSPWGGARSVAFGVGAMALLLYAAWETENRIVWIALAAQFLIAGLLRPAGAPDGARRLRALAVAGAIVATTVFAAAVVDRSALHFAGAAESLERDVRPRIWGVAWEKFREAPLLGHGFGREVLAKDFIPHTPTVLNHPQIRHGHNVFVDAALSLGIVGLALFVALLVLLAREYAGYLRRPDIAPLGMLGMMVLVGFLVKCLTDDFLHRHNGLVFWALNAMLLGLGRAAPAVMPPGEAAPR